MFAKVEYDGFDGRPDLRAVAEQGTRLLADEVRAEWHDKMSVGWAATSGRPELTLTVQLALPGATGVGVQPIALTDVTDPLYPDWFQSRVGRAWSRAASDYLEQRRPFLLEPILDTAEV